MPRSPPLAAVGIRSGSSTPALKATTNSRNILLVSCCRADRRAAAATQAGSSARHGTASPSGRRKSPAAFPGGSAAPTRQPPRCKTAPTPRQPAAGYRHAPASKPPASAGCPGRPRSGSAPSSPGTRRSRAAPPRRPTGGPPVGHEPPPPDSWNSAKPPGGARGRSDASGRRRRRNMRPVMAIHPHDAHETAAPRRGPRIHDAQCTAATTSPPDGRPPRELPDRWQSHASDRYQPGAQQEDAARSPRYARRLKTPSQRAEAEQAALRASLPARADHAT